MRDLHMLRRQELELDRCLRARRPMGPEVDVPEGSGAELLSDEEFPIPHILDTTYVGIHRFLGKDKEGFKKSKTYSHALMKKLWKTVHNMFALTVVITS